MLSRHLTQRLTATAHVCKRSSIKVVHHLHAPVAHCLRFITFPLAGRANVLHLQAQHRFTERVSEPPQPAQQRRQDRQNQPNWPKVLVVVEGLSDLRAVQRAVSAKVLVLHGASKISLPATQTRLRKLAAQAEQVIALLDPDVAGRQSRALLDKLLPGMVFHAFISGLHATASTDIRKKKAGNIGVEHATPDQVREALTNPRRSTAGRTEFVRADLVEWGLTVDMGTPPELQGGCVQRRAAVCFVLGLGNCDGKQLLKQLNNYDFTRQDVLQALEAVRAELRS